MQKARLTEFWQVEELVGDERYVHDIFATEADAQAFVRSQVLAAEPDEPERTFQITQAIRDGVTIIEVTDVAS